MPPICLKSSVELEGRLDFAISAYKNRQILSIRKAAAIFNVLCTTLQYCLKGCSTRGHKDANQHKLPPNEEELMK
jgi:hypothetical protein